MKKIILPVLLMLATPLIKVTPVHAGFMNYETVLTLNAAYSTVLEDDINLDGYMDFYISSGSYTGAYINNKNMTFTKVDIDTVGTYEGHKNNAQVVDFNGDGKKDILYGAAVVKVAYSNGNGTFATPITLYSERSSALHAADFNNDNKIDLAIGYDNGGRIKVLFQGNSGTFTAFQDPTYGGDIDVYYGGTRVNNIQSLDINGDNLLDIVFSDGGRYKLYSLLNEHFDEYDMYTTLYTASARINSFIVFDFDDDGDDDIVVGTNYLSGTQNTVLTSIRNNGAGFDTPVSEVDLSQSAYTKFGSMSTIKDIAVLPIDDANNSRHIVTGHESSGSQFGLNFFNVDKNNNVTDINGLPLTQRNKAHLITTVLTGDFNGDGSKDVMSVSASGSTTNFYFHQNDYTGFSLRFNTNGGTPIDPLYGVKTGIKSNAVTLQADASETLLDYDFVDFNNDGKTDYLLSGQKWTTSSVQMFSVIGDGWSYNFSPASPDVGNYNMEMIKGFRYNNNFYVIGYDTKSNKLLSFILNVATSTYTQTGTVADFSAASLGEASALNFGDTAYAQTHLSMIQLTDGTLLIYAPDQGSGNTYVFSYGFNGNGTFLGKIKDGSDATIVLSQPYAIQMADFNHDTYRDFVIGDAGAAENLTLLLGTSDPLIFTKSVITTLTGRYQYLDVADFDNDGWTDIVGTDAENTTVNKVVMFRNKGDNTFTATTISTFTLSDYQGSTLQYKDVVAKDIEGDGDIDVLVKSTNQYNPSMYFLNNGNGTFDKGHYINEIIRNGGYTYIEHLDVIEDSIGLDARAIFAINYSSINYYSIVFHTVYESDLSVALPDNPTRANATFNGWYTDLAKTTPYVAGTPITSTQTLYADWELQLVSITFKDEFGTVISTVSDLVPNSSLSGVSYPTLSPISGYTFKQWDQAIPATIGETSLVITAQYDANSYTISFNENGGSTVSDITADYDTTVTQPTNPTKTGHTFAGWYTESGLTNLFTFNKMPLNGATLYAKWTVNQYSITVKGGASEQIITIIQGLGNGFVITDMGRILAYGPNYGLGFNGGTGTTPAFTDMVEIFTLNEGETILFARNGDGFSNPFNFFVTSQGRVLVLGNNAEGSTAIGALATGDSNLLYTLTPIDITANFNLTVGEHIIDIQLGRFAGVALTNQGRVFTWGKNQYGTAGNDTIYVVHHSPTDITSYFNLASGDKVTLISMHEYAIMAATQQGAVYGWGWHAYGQTLGLGTTGILYYKVPTKVTMPLVAGETVSNLVVGMSSGFVITSNNRLIQWSNTSLNSGGSTPYVVTGVLQENEIVIDYDFGFYSGYIVTNQRVLARGGGNYGILADGINGGSTNNLWVDITANFNLGEGESITQIDIFHLSIMALTSEGRVLFFGYNSYIDEIGATGTTAPTEIAVPLLTATDKVIYFNYGDDISEFALDDAGGLYFRGFFNDEALNDPATLTSMPAENLVLYAKFVALLSYDMSGVQWNYESAFTYNGTEFTVTLDELTLPNGVTIQSYTFNKATNTGTYTATVTFNYDSYNYLEPTATLTWQILKATYDMSSVLWPDQTYTYNGNQQSVELSGLPTGVTPTYTNHQQTNAGTYTVSVSFTYDSDNYNEPTFANFTWTINKATFDFTNVTWPDQAYTYNGNQQSVGLSGLPQGVTANYTNHQQTNAGTYTVSVSFTYDGDNYNEPTFTNFTWTINKATFDFTNVKWPTSTYTYNGNQQSVELSGLPQGVTPTYTNHQQTNAGTYTVSVSFTYDSDNYNEPSFADFTWKINKANYDMSLIQWDYTNSFTYSGNSYTVLINEIDLPVGVTFKNYANNSYSAAGSYVATVSFNYDADNYNEPTVANLSWSIQKLAYDMSQVAWPNGTYTYNGTQQSVTLTGLPQGITAVYTNHQQTNAGTYTVSVTFNYDSANYIQPTVANYTWTIAKAVYDMSGVSWNYTDPFVENGSTFTVTLNGLPTGVTATYTNHTTNLPGTYSASATLNYDTTNYEAISVPSLSWTILPVYTVTIDVDGTLTTYTGLEGTTIPTIANPTKQGYQFKGWTSVIPSAIGNQDLTIRATWFLSQKYTEGININYQNILDAIDPDLIANKNAEVTLNVLVKALDSMNTNDIELLKTFVNEQLKINGEYVYLDVFLNLLVDGNEQPLTQLDQAIQISVVIPEKNQGKSEYYILRIHNGVAEILDTVYDETTHTLTFETDRFSTYAIVYESFSPCLWILLLLIPQLFFFLAFIFRKSNKAEEPNTPVVEDKPTIELKDVKLENVTHRPLYQPNTVVPEGHYLEVTPQLETSNRMVEVVDQPLPPLIVDENAYLPLLKKEVALFQILAMDLGTFIKKTPGTYVQEEGYYMEVDLNNHAVDNFIYAKRRLPPTTAKGHRWVHLKKRKLSNK